MKSPFPGMDPYLERFWLSFHNKLITYIGDALNGDSLPQDLRAEVNERVFIEYPDEPQRRTVLPDVYVSHRDSPAVAGAFGTAPSQSSSAIAVAEPVLYHFPDDAVRETFIEITDLSGSKLITAIELLSASTKLRGKDRDKHLQKREEYLGAGVNVVEIDLYRPGLRTLDRLDDRFDAHYHTPYFVITHRAPATGDFELTALPFRTRLPAFKIPLRSGEPDAIIDIQPLIDRVYANGRYPIDYTAPLKPPVAAEHQEWAEALLAQRPLGQTPKT